MTKDYPKVLVSTIPSWSEKSGANTFSTLFDGYPPDKLANIYTRADLPTSTVCSRYFRIIEGRVLKSIVKRGLKTGDEVSAVTKEKSSDNETQAETKRYSFFTKHRWALFLWLRELGWILGKWKSTELENFLSDFNPEIFVFHIESYWYFNRLNQYLINKLKPHKVIGYLWDDNFTYKQHPYSLIAKLNRFVTRKQVKKLVKLSDTVLAISPQMKRECDKEFGIDSVLLTKPILLEQKTEYVLSKSVPIRIVYSGSLVIGRDKSIALLVECLKEINKKSKKFFLDIYSGTALTKAQIDCLSVPDVSNLKGHIPQNEVFLEQQKADILLFVEDLNNKKNNAARLSFSTKITDYLSRNRAILAIGPSDIAPITYLKEENAAIVCHNKEDILRNLWRIIDNPNILNVYASNAYACGVRNHSREKIINTFRNIIAK